MDFMTPVLMHPNRGKSYIYPVFNVMACEDIMIRGHDFYAVWDHTRDIWSTDQDTVVRLVDDEMRAYYESLPEDERKGVGIKYMRDSTSGSIDAFHKYVRLQARDNYISLNSRLVFANEKAARDLYSTKRLPYSITEQETPGYDKLMSTLYSDVERAKIEWSIGAILSGDSRRTQKFIVFYGAMGTGKSTVLHIIEQLFTGYWSAFDAESLGTRSDSFALEAFKDSPLVAIQHDGDLSRIETNTRLNSIVSHEPMVINEKYKSQYVMTPISFLYMGTNKPVKITDAKSGLLRRLIDVRPTGNVLDRDTYERSIEMVKFELGGIAYKCLRFYLEHKKMYDGYVPYQMMERTNHFYNFMEENYEVFSKQDSTTLKSAWAMYKEYVDYAKVPYPMSMQMFAGELRNYFATHVSDTRVDGAHVRNYYRGFRHEKFSISGNGVKAIVDAPVVTVEQGKEAEAKIAAEITADSGTAGAGAKKAAAKKNGEIPDWLQLRYAAEIEQETGKKNFFDRFYADCKAQLARKDRPTPQNAWSRVTTTLSSLNTSEVHYILMPDATHICIDFDLTDEDGNKSLQKNLEAAASFPPTYAEVSKSGGGLHLHYIYTGGDPEELSRVYSDGIEVKVFSGKQSLRRRLSLTNGYEGISYISSGLPLKSKGAKAMVNWQGLANEKALRTVIKKNLAKECAPGTKPSVDLIAKSLEEAYESGMHYDVTDMRPAILAFAMQSTNHASYCIDKVNRMKWKSDEPSEVEAVADENKDSVIFFDIEVFPNLLVVCWKVEDSDTVNVMINPKPYEIEELCQHKLVGFNNRKYDNHILYACMMGYSNYDLYILSKRLIAGSPNAGFGEAYGLAWADVYDYSSKKQSLKKFEIDLGIHHQELGIPWDEPVPEERWEEVGEYCKNDVIATEAVFKDKDRKADLVAREILAELSGLTISHTTQQHVTKIIYGGERHPKNVYTDLSTIFPGYEFCSTGIDPDRYVKDENGKPIFSSGKSIYMGEDPSEGGYVYAKPGIYWNVWTFDVASLHPSSILALNKFGEHTAIYREIRDARVAIKHGDFEKARTMLGGRLAKYLTDEKEAKKLANALKLVLNSTYGYCSASFDCPFKDPRDVDNIVAKRGALFMITLKNKVIEMGYEVIHCKTDSIKVVAPDDRIIDFIYKFGEQYGYSFEIEAKYERICLVNRAVYVAKEESGKWTATGTQFQVPYVFKTLFSKEPLVFTDKCVTKSVKTSMFLDMNEGLGEGQHKLQFVGRCGQYCPIKSGCGGGLLVRDDPKKPGKYDAVTGTKGYRWLESETVQALGKEEDIDTEYFAKMVDDALDAIREFGDVESFMD